MSLFRTIAMLASAVLVVLFFYFVGHGIAVHEMRPVFVGLGFLVLSAVLIFLQTRQGRA